MLHVDDLWKMSCAIDGCKSRSYDANPKGCVVMVLDHFKRQPKRGKRGKQGEMPLCAKHASAYLVAKARACKAQAKREKAAAKAPRQKRAPKVENVLADLRELAPSPRPSITIWAA